MKRIIVATALTVVATLGVGGCAGSSSGTEPQGPPKPGGSLTVYIPSEVTSLSPGVSGRTYFESMIYGNLITLDASGMPHPVMAESIGMVDNDPAHWNLTLRQGLRFTNGEPLNASAVKYNWEWHADAANGSWIASNVKDLLGELTVVSDVSLDIKLTRANPDFYVDVVSPLNSPAAPSSLADKQRNDRNPVGAGPYMFDSWVEGSKLRLARNPGYFDPERPYLDQIEIVPVPDSSQMVNVLAANPNSIALAPSGRVAADFQAAGVSTVSQEGPGGPNFFLNNRNAPFDDVRARQAVARALDLNDLNASVFDDTESVATGVYPPDHPYFNKDVHQLSYDKSAAQQLVDAYVAEKGPMNFSIVAPPTEPYASMAQWAAQQLNTLSDVKVTVEQLESNTWQTRVNGTYAYNMSPFNTGWNGAVSGNFNIHRTPNRLGYSDPDVDALFDDLEVQSDLDERKSTVDALLRFTYEDVPIVWAVRAKYFWARGSAVGGLEMWGKSDIHADELFVSQ
ncbi:ABC transporter substrate-binding protein [Rhodococcus koreensis]